MKSEKQLGTFVLGDSPHYFDFYFQKSYKVPIVNLGRRSLCSSGRKGRVNTVNGPRAFSITKANSGKNTSPKLYPIWGGSLFPLQHIPILPSHQSVCRGNRVKRCWGCKKIECEH